MCRGLREYIDYTLNPEGFRECFLGEMTRKQESDRKERGDEKAF